MIDIQKIVEWFDEVEGFTDRDRGMIRRGIDRALSELSKVECDRESFLEVARKWKSFWMNQRQNDEADFQNYFNRALGVDANMTHHLAKMMNEHSDKAIAAATAKLTIMDQKLREARNQIIAYEGVIYWYSKDHNCRRGGKSARTALVKFSKGTGI